MLQFNLLTAPTVRVPEMPFSPGFDVSQCARHAGGSAPGAVSTTASSRYHQAAGGGSDATPLAANSIAPAPSTRLGAGGVPMSESDLLAPRERAGRALLRCSLIDELTTMAANSDFNNSLSVKVGVATGASRAIGAAMAEKGVVVVEVAVKDRQRERGCAAVTVDAAACG
jgi:hypothetical protein